MKATERHEELTLSGMTIVRPHKVSHWNLAYCSSCHCVFFAPPHEPTVKYVCSRIREGVHHPGHGRVAVMNALGVQRIVGPRGRELAVALVTPCYERSGTAFSEGVVWENLADCFTKLAKSITEIY